MGLFSKKCDICFQMKNVVKKNKRGLNICNDCKKTALDKISKEEFQNGNIYEISYVTRNGSLSKTIQLIENQNYTVREALDELKPDQEDVDLMLKNDEICYYYGGARAYNEKNIITEYTTLSSGISVRAIKGITIRNGDSTSIPIRNNVSETFEGHLYITNKRIVLLCKKYGFDLSIDTINAMQPFKNGFRLYYKDKCYTVITYDNSTIFYVFELIKRLLSGDGEKQITSKESFKLSYDELYEKAKELVIDLQRASASLIQLKLKIDYDTAVKIINKLEHEKIIGAANGDNPRAVLIKK